MRRPPDITSFPRYPVTAGTALLAIGVTLAYWTGWNVAPLMEDGNVRRWELWRLVSSALPHGNGYHLIFNLYWTWAFGTLVEETFGHLKTAALFVLLALGSGAAEYALMSGGIGLSGVGYGLFGMLWVLSRRDQRFAGAVDANTSMMFVAWFFVCIVLTRTGAMPVANVAHAAGAALGGLVGVSICHRGAVRRLAAGTIAAFVIAGIAGSTVARPWVNVSKDGGHGEFALGYEALKDGRNAEAVRWLRDGIRMNPAWAGGWYNLGLAHERLGHARESLAAYAEASRLSPGNVAFYEAWVDAGGRLAAKGGNYAGAVEFYTAVTRSKPGFAAGWFGLASAYDALEKNDQALEAYRHAHERAPQNVEYGAVYADRMAYRAEVAGNLAEARDWLLKAISFKLNDAWAWHRLGNVYERSGEPDKAIEPYAKAHQFDPHIKAYRDDWQRAARIPTTAPTTKRATLSIDPGAD
jgi:membrane associated rhomboid family serine protease/Tfp pilus assembly protein PilF